MNKDLAKLNDLTITTDNIALKIKAEVSHLQTDKPEFVASVQTNDINVRALLKKYAIAYESLDKKVLNLLNLSFQLKGNPAAFSLDNLKITLDDTNFTGNARIKNDDPLNLYARLMGDDIDVDRYLPPKSDSKAADETSKTKAEDSVANSSNPELPDLTLDVQFKMGHVKVANLHTDNIIFTVKGKNKSFHLYPVETSMYGGKASIDATINGAKKTPTFKVKETLKNVNIGNLLKDLTGEDRLTGNANLNFNLTTQGWDIKQQKKFLNGTAKFAFTDGAVKGFNIAHTIRKVNAALTGKKVEQEAPAQTDFSSMKGTAKINKGLLTNNDFTASSPLLRINGKGTFNINNNVVDYRVKTYIVDSLEGQSGKDLKDLAGIPIPVYISGPVDNIKVKPELDKVVEARAKKEIKKTIEKKIGGQAGQLLQGFFK